MSAGGLALVTSADDIEAILGSLQDIGTLPVTGAGRSRSGGRKVPSTQAEGGASAAKFVSSTELEYTVASTKRLDSSMEGKSSSRQDGLSSTDYSQSGEDHLLSGTLPIVPFSTEDGIVRDWKGDPIVLNAADKLPFKLR